MIKRRFVITLCIVILAGSTLAFIRQEPNNHSAPKQNKGIPPHVVYRQVFHHVFTIKEKAKDLEREGKNGNELRASFKKKAQLSDEDDRVLTEVASDSEREVAQQDAKAKAVIDKFKERYPDGKIPQGETLPSAPPELEALQQERDAIILRARDRLRVALGEQKFKRFDDFVNREIVPHIQPVPLNRQRPAAPIGQRRQPMPTKLPQQQK